MFLLNKSPSSACAPLSAIDSWTEEKMLRVWTPAGWTKEGAPPGGWPVLWMNDGQNMFEDHLAHQVGLNCVACFPLWFRNDSRGAAAFPTACTFCFQRLEQCHQLFTSLTSLPWLPDCRRGRHGTLGTCLEACTMP